MTGDLPIHDLWIRPIGKEAQDAIETWHVLGFGDHVLRRLGSLQVVRLPAGASTAFRVHDSSDEIWGLIDGRAECRWLDMRSDSPSYDQSHRDTLDRPTGVLVPFGVAFGARAIDGPALFVRIMTLSESEAGPSRILDWPSGA